MNWLGRNVFGDIMIRRRHFLPGEIWGALSTQKKTDYSDNKKVAWFFHSVVATKNTEKVAEKRTGGNGGGV